MTYKDDARSSKAGKVRRMLGPETDMASKIKAEEGSRPAAVDTKRPGAVTDSKLDGNKPVKRLDKPARARGGSVKGKGKTVVNVIVPPGHAQAPAGMPVPMAQSPIPPVAPAGAPPMPSGGGPASMPPGAPAAGALRPPVPQVAVRQRGGRVKMDAGAGSGLGRQEKVAL